MKKKLPIRVLNRRELNTLKKDSQGETTRSPLIKCQENVAKGGNFENAKNITSF